MRKMWSKDKVDGIVKDAFYQVQFEKTSHRNYMKKLKKCYEQSELQTFWESFSKYVAIPLTMGQRHPRIENTLEFLAKFAVSFCTFTDDEATNAMCPFLQQLFDFLLSHHNAKDSAARFRICHFLNMLLNSMGDNAFIDDLLCDKITVNMMDRLLDRSPKVRAQAVLALHRLQDPSDEECPVIKMYLFHLAKDPQANVRIAVLASMGKNQRTLQAALTRTRDVDDRVRKMAYTFISKITIRSLSIKQRQQLLNDGLKDRSEVVSKCVEQVLLPTWLNHFNKEYMSLIKALDAEIGPKPAILALNSLFKSADLKTLLDQTPVDQETRVIPINNITSESVLYWRCVIEHLQKENYTEELETILPELSTFCKYIHEFLTMMSSDKCDTNEELSHKFICLQLFEIVKIYDLSDEVGRNNLRELILHTLMLSHCTKDITECVVKHLEKVMPDVNGRLDALVNIISELRLPTKQGNTQVTQISETQHHENKMQRAKLSVQLLQLQEDEYQAIQQKDYMKAEQLKGKIASLKQEMQMLTEVKETTVPTNEVFEEKNDPETMIKCLTITYTMMQAKSVSTLVPTLMSLMEIVFSSLDHSDDEVHILALKIVTIYCVLDKELAKKHIVTFFAQFSLELENQQIWYTALQAIFDLLLYYGLEHFDFISNEELSVSERSERSRVKLYSNTNEDYSDVSTTKKDEPSNCNFIKILTGLLDNENSELRTIAAEGLSKLLLSRRISGYGLVSRLIILCYNPANDGDFYLRQCLYTFFNYYACSVPESQEVLENAFLPTLRVICNATDLSPLQEIDPYEVAKFILNLTKNGTSKSATGNCCTHNNLTFRILSEILDPDSDVEKEVLIKSLKDLDIQIDDESSMKNVDEAINKISEMVTDSDKHLLKYIMALKNKIHTPNVPSHSVENTRTDDMANDSRSTSAKV